MQRGQDRTSGALDLRRLNRNRIFRFICSQARTSKLEISQTLQISMPTVLQNIKELLADGLVCEIGEFKSTGGRKAKVLAPISDVRLSVGVDITRNHVSLVLADLSGTVLRHRRIPFPFARTPEYSERLGRLVTSFVDEEGVHPERILGVGVSIPGIISASGDVITSAHTLDLVNVPCVEFSREIPWPCIFLNDANAAGAAEFGNPAQPWSGRNAVYLSLSNSVGGAIHLNGGLFAGENQRAGEFGHMCLIPGGLTCYCGKLGCADSYCSALTLTAGLEVSLSGFFSRLAEGDAVCETRWKPYADHLTRLANNLRMAFDCDVVLGGYVGGHLADRLPELQRRVSELGTFDTDGSWLSTCRFKLEASALGAALQHVNAYLRTV